MKTFGKLRDLISGHNNILKYMSITMSLWSPKIVGSIHLLWMDCYEHFYINFSYSEISLLSSTNLLISWAIRISSMHRNPWLYIYSFIFDMFVIRINSIINYPIHHSILMPSAPKKKILLSFQYYGIDSFLCKFKVLNISYAVLGLFKITPKFGDILWGFTAFIIKSYLWLWFITEKGCETKSTLKKGSPQ